MATEVTCPSPFSAAGSLSSDVQVELVVSDYSDIVTWNSADKDPDVTLSVSALTAAYGNVGSVRATGSKTSGKWYWEVRVDTGRVVAGIGTSGANINIYPGKDALGYGYQVTGRTYHNNAPSGIKCVIVDTDIVGIALDLDNNKLWFLNNNSPINGGDPAAGTGEDYSGLAGTFFPMCGGTILGQGTARFKPGDQSYAPPAGFSAIYSPPLLLPFTAEGSLSISQIYPGYIGLDEALSAESSFNGILQPEISADALSAVASLHAAIQVDVDCNDPFEAVAGFSCDHCFNYAQIAADCPTPTCEMAAVFRYARIDADVPVPTASFVVGKKIEGDVPVPTFTCNAFFGRNPSIIASSPVPTCSMTVGLSFTGDVPVPTCIMTATTHHLATIYGNVPCPGFTCTADTENITVISASVPCPGGVFSVTVGNVASICGRAPCPSCSMLALTGQVVGLAGRVPVPGSLVRFYASLKNETITLTGTVPTPTMISRVHGLESSILRHIRGEVR